MWSLLTAATGVATNFVMLLLIRLGVGVGEASYAPAANSLIADLYPAARRARAIGVFMLGLPLGLGASNLLSGIITQQLGWRQALYVAAAPGFVLRPRPSPYLRRNSLSSAFARNFTAVTS